MGSSAAKVVTDKPTGIAGWWHRWTRSQQQVEADEIQEQMGADDLTIIRNCSRGDTVTVGGYVRSMTLRPRTTVPALEVDLYDGTGAVSVVWLGRRRIPGIEPGRSMVVCGRLTGTEREPVIYNPKYTLKPMVG